MKLFVLPLLFSVAALAQTPVPPACLSGPVTLGNVTITCSLMDFTQANHAGDQSIVFVAANGYVFQVRASSSDPGVVGVRIGVTSGTKASPETSWGVTGVSSPAALTSDPASIPVSFRYTFYLSSTAISSIQIQELKASNSQTF